jgi:hypothetical protein
VSVSTCGGLIHGRLIFGGGLIFRGLRYTVEKSLYFLVIDTLLWVHIEQLGFSSRSNGNLILLPSQ